MQCTAMQCTVMNFKLQSSGWGEKKVACWCIHHHPFLSGAERAGQRWAERAEQSKKQMYGSNVRAARDYNQNPIWIAQWLQCSHRYYSGLTGKTITSLKELPSILLFYWESLIATKVPEREKARETLCGMSLIHCVSRSPFWLQTWERDRCQIVCWNPIQERLLSSTFIHKKSIQ